MKEERLIGTEMGVQKCCTTHKVVQPWAVDTASLRELPATSPSPLMEDPLRGPPTWGVKPLPTTPVTPKSEAKETQRLSRKTRPKKLRG